MSYPSDITGEQFAQIRPLLESARKTTRPRKYDLHQVFNGLLYVMKTGCQWRALPKDYPNYRTVHNYFQIWSAVPGEGGESILDRVLKKNGRYNTYQRWQRLLHDHGYR